MPDTVTRQQLVEAVESALPRLLVTDPNHPAIVALRRAAKQTAEFTHRDFHDCLGRQAGADWQHRSDHSGARFMLADVSIAAFIRVFDRIIDDLLRNPYAKMVTVID